MYPKKGQYVRTERHLEIIRKNAAGRPKRTSLKSYKPFTFDLTLLWGEKCRYCHTYGTESYFHKSGGHCGILNKETYEFEHMHIMCECGKDWVKPL
jgi:hypothetical protein